MPWVFTKNEFSVDDQKKLYRRVGNEFRPICQLKKHVSFLEEYNSTVYIVDTYGDCYSTQLDGGDGDGRVTDKELTDRELTDRELTDRELDSKESNSSQPPEKLKFICGVIGGVTALKFKEDRLLMADNYGRIWIFDLAGRILKILFLEGGAVKDVKDETEIDCEIYSGDKINGEIDS